MVINLDFDGTCVEHKYPRIGKSIGAEPILLELVNKGHKLILFTMRDGKTLKDAVDWFVERNIPLYGVQRNPNQHWTSSPKSLADLIIDDTNLFMPLINENGSSYCDWGKIREELVNKGIL